MTFRRTAFTARRVLLGVSLGTLLGLGGCSDAPPKPVLWDRWSSHDERSTVSVDYTAWNELLQRYVHTVADGSTRFDYAGISATDRNRLQGVVNQLEREPIGLLDRREQHAYWINLYNAATLDWLVSQPPKLTLGALLPTFGEDPRRLQQLDIAGEPLSIDDIRDRILRPLWPDPLTLYALADGSLGSPPLAPGAYIGVDLDERLEAQATRYVNSSEATRIVAGKLEVAAFFRRFETDFGGEAGILSELRRHAAPPLVTQLRGINRIDSFFDDTRLNAWHPADNRR